MKTLIVTAALIEEGGKILVTQRKKEASHGLLWEFPGGKVEEEEEPREALRRELKEELDIETEVGSIFESVYHFYPEGPLLLLVYSCRIKKGEPKPIGCHDLKWVSPDQLRELAMPPADQSICDRLASLKNPSLS